MTITVWLRRLKANIATASAKRKSTGVPRRRLPLHKIRPRFETLEDRTLLSVSINEFMVPTAGSFPRGITAGPDGNIWFTEESGNRIGEINPTTHVISEFALTTGSYPRGITAGPDGNLWFAEPDGDRIGKINPTTHAISEFPVTRGSFPVGIAAGPDGN